MKIFKFCCIAMLMFTASCATYGSIEDYWGKSYQTAKSKQIVNPSASGNLKAPEGLNGRAADTTMKKYVDSFATNHQGQQASPNSVAVQPQN